MLGHSKANTTRILPGSLILALGAILPLPSFAQTIQGSLVDADSQAGLSGALITLIGGLTRMDEMAQGIVQYSEHHGLSVPAVIRMAGTQEEAGKAILGEAGLGTFDDLTAAVEAVVKLARAGA